MIDFFEFSNEMLCLANRQGYFIRVNQAWTRTLGWSSAELTSRPYLDFVHPDDAAATLNEASLLYTGEHETICFENRYLCQDGSYKWLAWHVRREPDSDQLVAAARDVTEQKLQAEALRHSEERFRHLVTNAPVGIFVADLQGNCLFVNERWCEMAGIPGHLALGDGWKSALEATDLSRVAADWMRAVANGAAYNDEARFRKPSGELVWLEISAAPLLGEDGQPVSYIGTTVDITERIDAMASITAEQNLLQQSIELQDHERKRIAFDIHDGIIQYATGALLHLLGYHSLLTSTENVEQLESAIKALRQTITEGRRVMNGIQTPVLEQHGVTAAIEEFVMERRTENTTIEFLPPAQTIRRLTAEWENAIYRMAQEAINNALKHSQSSKVRVTLNYQDDRIGLNVKDWGVGITVKAQSRGVHGLRGIKERVRLLKGTFDLETHPGQGTTIDIILPLPPDAIGNPSVQR